MNGVIIKTNKNNNLSKITGKNPRIFKLRQNDLSQIPLPTVLTEMSLLPVIINNNLFEFKKSCLKSKIIKGINGRQKSNMPNNISFKFTWGNYV